MGRTVNSKWNAVGISGMSRFAVDLSKVMRERADKICEMAVRDVAEQVLEQALEWVPRDTGALADSGRVEYVEKRGNAWVTNIVFGDSSVNYAFFVENDIPTGVVKNYTTPGTGAFFLTRAGDNIATAQNFTTALRKAAQQIGG